MEGLQALRCIKIVQQHNAHHLSLPQLSSAIILCIKLLRMVGISSRKRTDIFWHHLAQSITSHRKICIPGFLGINRGKE